VIGFDLILAGVDVAVAGQYKFGRNAGKLFQTLLQLLSVAAGQICTADSVFENDISSDQDLIDGRIETNRSRRMTGGVKNLQGQIAQLQIIFL